MSNFQFPSALNPGALAWLSEYNGSLQSISDNCLCIWTGIPLWKAYEGPDYPVLVVPGESSPFGKTPDIENATGIGDPDNAQFYGLTKDIGRKQYGTETGGSAPVRLDTNIADVVRVGCGGYVPLSHTETAGTPAYFNKETGVLSTVAGTLLIGVFMPDNEIMIYPNRE